jgi:4-amino-4-deoxy-L-arabinose transferase-like glycosyltransferase
VPPPREQRTRRVTAWTILTLALLAFVVRIGFQIVSGIDAPPRDDAVQYDSIGWSLAQGGAFATSDGLRSTRAPTYPVVLAATYALVGHSWAAARVVQALIGAATCAGLMILGSRLYDGATGALAGLVYALFPYAIFWSSTILSEPICAFLCLVATWLLVRSRDGDWRWAMAWCVACGLATLTRPNAALLFALGLVWLIAHRPRRLRFAVCATFCFLLVLAPWTVRNYLVHHRLVFVTTMGGRVLWEGNNPYVAADPGLRGRSANAPDLPEAAQVAGLDEASADAAYFRMGLAWMRQHPRDSVELMGIKALRLWNLSPNLENPTHRLIASASMAAVLLCFVAGLLAAAWQRDARLVPLLLPLVMVTVTGVVYWADARIRAPADPEIILVAATAAVGAWRACRARFHSAALD